MLSIPLFFVMLSAIVQNVTVLSVVMLNFVHQMQQKAFYEVLFNIQHSV